MTAQPSAPIKTSLDSHDTSQVYVHREPSALRKALPWIVLAVIVLGLGYLGYALWQTMAGRQPRPTPSGSARITPRRPLALAVAWP